jgi:hypothetical protein
VTSSNSMRKVVEQITCPDCSLILRVGEVTNFERLVHAFLDANDLADTGRHATLQARG